MGDCCLPEDEELTVEVTQQVFQVVLSQPAPFMVEVESTTTNVILDSAPTVVELETKTFNVELVEEPKSVVIEVEAFGPPGAQGPAGPQGPQGVRGSIISTGNGHP